MMSYEQWLTSIIDAVRDIASSKFQEEAWFPGGKVVSSPEEIFLVLMEDFTFDLFFETYGKEFTTQQVQAWRELRSLLVAYYDKLPAHPDARRVLTDPAWDLVRQSAERFVRAFRLTGTEDHDGQGPRQNR